MNKKHLVTQIIITFSGAADATEADNPEPIAWPPQASGVRSPPRMPGPSS